MFLLCFEFVSLFLVPHRLCGEQSKSVSLFKAWYCTEKNEDLFNENLDFLQKKKKKDLFNEDLDFLDEDLLL